MRTLELSKVIGQNHRSLFTLINEYGVIVCKEEFANNDVEGAARRILNGLRVEQLKVLFNGLTMTNDVGIGSVGKLARDIMNSYPSAF
jgi:hypothetical protein